MSGVTATEVVIDQKTVKLTSLDKLMWPEGLTKAHLIKYYTDMAPYLLPYIAGRPLVMKRYPHGIQGKAFYQKECPDYAPDWIKTVKINHTDKAVNYIYCNDVATLVWLANQGCIEVHGWLSKKDQPDLPDTAVIDLDPGEETSFAHVLSVALVVKQILDYYKLAGYPKTSGASGLHIFIPLKPVYNFPEVTRAMGLVAAMVTQVLPEKATVERMLAKRPRHKVYVDYLQNTRGKSMAWTYSLRPLPGAPVSTPLDWAEIESMAISPDQFTIHTVFSRIERFGDLYRPMLNQKQELEPILV